MIAFIDTSALLAILDADDRHHAKAGECWRKALTNGVELVTSNYVLVETYAVAQRRLGLAAVGAIARAISPALHVYWLDPEVHSAAVESLLAASRRKLSFVDCTSFALMHRHGIEHVLAFDPHFQEMGFRPFA